MRWETPQQAEELYGAVGALLKRHAMIPVPHNFELCFRYLQGADAALVQAFDDCVLAKRAGDPDFTQELHRQYIGPGADLARMTAKIEQTLKQLVVSLSETSDSSAAYGTSLSAAALQLNQPASPEGLAQLIGTVATATQRMIETNRKLDQNVRSSAEEMSALRSKVDALRSESLMDALTGLANRRSFDQALESHASEASDGKRPLSVLMCDIDHFKKFNDTWGHQTGDQVLRLVAKCVASCVEPTDVAARYGGEELSVILPDADLAKAQHVAERIRFMVEQRQIVKKSSGEKLGSITLSIGCAQLVSGEDAAGMLARADESLYEAKRTGRNRVCASALAQTKSA